MKRSGLRLEDVACVQAGYLYPEIAEHLPASLGPRLEVRRTTLTASVSHHVEGLKVAAGTFTRDVKKLSCCA